MATAGMGVGSFDNELYTARAGETLHDGRYKIIKRLLSTEQCAFPYGYATYLALDTKTSRHVCVKTLGKSASGTVSFAREQELAGGKDAASACQCLLLPIDTFQHEGHTCLVTELVGPDLFYMREAGGPSSSCFPPRWIRQVAHGALQGLKYLDGQGVVHGALEWSALVITYPQVDASDATAVEKIYGPFPSGDEDGRGIFGFNETGTAVEEAAHWGFQVKLQNLSDSFDAKKVPAKLPSPKFIDLQCPPPERELEGSAGPPADVWSLGTVLADLFSASPEFATLIGAQDYDSTENLLQSQDVLGPLPSHFAKMVLQKDPKRKAADVPKPAFHEDLHKAVVEGRKAALEGGGGRDDVGKEGDFEEKELEMAVDLLKKMLNYEPGERLTAEAALDHAFFGMKRLET